MQMTRSVSSCWKRLTSKIWNRGSSEARTKKKGILLCTLIPAPAAHSSHRGRRQSSKHTACLVFASCTEGLCYPREARQSSPVGCSCMKLDKSGPTRMLYSVYLSASIGSIRSVGGKICPTFFISGPGYLGTGGARSASKNERHHFDHGEDLL